MDSIFYLFLSVSGLVVGLFSGLLGIGGALLMFPILIYVPGLFGMSSIPVHIVTGMTSMQTLSGTAASSYFHHKTGNVSKKLVVNVGTGIAIGAFTGAICSQFLSALFLKWLYFLILLLVFILLLLPQKDNGLNSFNEDNLSKRKCTLFGLAVGLPAGAIGLAGSTVIIPLLNSIFSVPIKICISSCTHIAFIASSITFIGKLITGQIELMAAIVISISATTGAYLGTKLNKKVNTGILRIILIILVVIAVLRLLYDIILT